jgi:hypothetical protein
MKDSTVTLSGPAIPPEVEEFAAARGVSHYLSAAIELARQAFPSSELCVSLGQDAEDDSHQYVALDVKVGDQTTQGLVAGQRAWSSGIHRICPPRQAVYFVLGWR